MFVVISYGSPKSRLPCFLNGDFAWVPVLYTMERPDSASPAAKGLAETKPILVSGPYRPKVKPQQNQEQPADKCRSWLAAVAIVCLRQSC